MNICDSNASRVKAGKKTAVMVLEYMSDGNVNKNSYLFTFLQWNTPPSLSDYRKSLAFTLEF